MATLVISDVHEQITTLKSIVAKYADVESVVFLGDWLDSRRSQTGEAEETVKWLAENVGNSRYTFVWGNHDLQYALPLRATRCGDFDQDKLKLVRGHLSAKHWQRFKLLHWIDTDSDSWLCSHAGLHPSLLHPVLGFDRSALAAMETDAMDKLQRHRQVSPLLGIGEARGGDESVGGVTWLDWNLEFQPVVGLNQIVGHTFGKDVRTANASDSRNYCMDTGVSHLLLVENDGNVRIEAVEV